MRLHMVYPSRFAAALGFCLLLQLGFWWQTHHIRPGFDVVPTPPGKAALHALSFGDDEFYFRMKAMELQNFGDEYGRTISLRYYDYSNLYQWMLLLDSLDSRSDMLPSMAANYFSQIQTTADISYMVHYLYAHATRDVVHKWWWLLQCVYLSMHDLKDMDMALRAAKPMITPGVPIWAQEMTAVVYEKRGEMEDARHIIDTIQANADYIPDQDLKYMRYFVEERLNKLEHKDKMYVPGKPVDAEK